MSFYRDQLEDWLKTIDVKADKVLDVGGSANPVPGRVKSWDAKEYKILDNCNERRWHDKWTTPNWDKSIELAGIEVDIGMTFDCIFMLEVAEYLSYPSLAIGNISKLCNKGGIFYSSWPSIYPVHEPRQQDRLRYTGAWIVQQLSKVGFHSCEVIARKATAGRDALQQFYSLEKMRAAKETDVIYDIGYMVKSIKE